MGRIVRTASTASAAQIRRRSPIVAVRIDPASSSRYRQTHHV
jgi:hypothetical protein